MQEQSNSINNKKVVKFKSIEDFKNRQRSLVSAQNAPTVVFPKQRRTAFVNLYSKDMAVPEDHNKENISIKGPDHNNRQNQANKANRRFSSMSCRSFDVINSLRNKRFSSISRSSIDSDSNYYEKEAHVKSGFSRTHKHDLSLDSPSNSVYFDNSYPRFSFLGTNSPANINLKNRNMSDSNLHQVNHPRTNGHNLEPNNHTSIALESKERSSRVNRRSASGASSNLNLSFGSKRLSAISMASNSSTPIRSHQHPPVITITNTSGEKESVSSPSSTTSILSSTTSTPAPRKAFRSSIITNANNSSTTLATKNLATCKSRSSVAYRRLNPIGESSTMKYERITNSLIQMFDNLKSSNQNKAQLIEKLQNLKSQNAKNQEKLEGLLSKIKQVKNNFEVYDSKVENDCTLIMICMCLIKNI